MAGNAVHKSTGEEILPLAEEEVQSFDQEEYQRFIKALHQPGMREQVISILKASGLLPASL